MDRQIVCWHNYYNGDMMIRPQFIIEAFMHLHIRHYCWIHIHSGFQNMVNFIFFLSFQRLRFCEFWLYLCIHCLKIYICENVYSVLDNGLFTLLLQLLITMDKMFSNIRKSSFDQNQKWTAAHELRMTRFKLTCYSFAFWFILIRLWIKKTIIRIFCP